MTQTQHNNNPDNVHALLEIFPIIRSNEYDRLCAKSVLEDILVFCENENVETIEYIGQKTGNRDGLVSFAGIISNIYYKLKSKTGTHKKDVGSLMHTEGNTLEPAESVVFVIPYYENLPDVPETDFHMETGKDIYSYTSPFNDLSETSVKLTHIPTNLTVMATNSKKTISENQHDALKVLKNKILHTPPLYETLLNSSTK